MVVMPDYSAEMEFSAPDFAAPEFRMLRRQLLPLLAASPGVRGTRVDRSGRRITADVLVSAPSSSTARARAGSLARGLVARLARVRTGRVSVRVELNRRERVGAEREDGPRTLVPR